jgi:hypothetical protein
MVPALCDSALTAIGICPQEFTRKLALAGVFALLLACAGCGGDDEAASTAPSTSTEAVATHAETSPVETATERSLTEPSLTETATAEPETSPEAMPGGAGDAEPARTLALFTGRDGRITPRVVRVPAFIAVQIELRSGDGATYALRFGSITIKAGGNALGSSSPTIDGLRPGETIVGRPTGQGNRVTISATAEPGP